MNGYLNLYWKKSAMRNNQIEKITILLTYLEYNSPCLFHSLFKQKHHINYQSETVEGMNIKKNKNNGHKLTIAHFSWEFPPAIWGGLGTFTTELTKQQSLFGHNVNVFALNDDNKLKQEESYNGVKVYRPKTIDFSDSLSLFSNSDLQSWGQNISFFSSVFAYNLFSANTLIETLVKSHGKKIDIIDGHDWLGILGGMIAKKSLNLPLIFHVHSTEQGRSLGYGSQTIQHIEKKGIEYADAVITVSNAMKDQLTQLGYPFEKIHVCWNGIDPDKYHMKKVPKEKITNLRKQYGIKDDEIFLFFIGRLVTVKGIKELILAMPSIIVQHPKVKLVVLGVGDLEDELKILVNNFGIQNHVIFRNEFVSEEERILHYAASDIVILPSLYEPFGIVCTEAMSMEKPVIVGAQGVNGMREQIIPDRDEQCGLHINPNDPQDITWGVNTLLEKRDLWEWMGENGRTRVQDLFTWEHVAKRTLDIYHNFI
jgi:glycosyltransferase involved in cell wall biosynthesis